MRNNAELDFEIFRIQQLMEVQNGDRNIQIRKANKLISNLSKVEPLWPEKVKIIGYLIILSDETSKNKYETKRKLKNLLARFPELDSYTKEMRGEFNKYRINLDD